MMTALASIIGKSFLAIPYTNQIETFDIRIKIIQMDKSPTDFDFHALYTCGTNVSEPETTPTKPK